MPLDPEFVADCPYAPGGLLLDEILSIDADKGHVTARMLTHEDLPLTREQRRAETAAANKAGELTPAGGGEAPKAKSTTKSNVSRDQRKAETAKMNQEGQLAPAGGSLAEPAHGKPSTKTKAQRAAEIEEARKKGEMVPAGGGHPTK